LDGSAIVYLLKNGLSTAHRLARLVCRVWRCCTRLAGASRSRGSPCSSGRRPAQRQRAGAHLPPRVWTAMTTRGRAAWYNEASPLSLLFRSLPSSVAW